MDHVEVVHIQQSVDDIDQLYKSVRVSHKITTTHKLETVHFEVLHAIEVLNDIPLVRPFGDQA